MYVLPPTDLKGAEADRWINAQWRMYQRPILEAKAKADADQVKAEAKAEIKAWNKKFKKAEKVERRRERFVEERRARQNAQYKAFTALLGDAPPVDTGDLETVESKPLVQPPIRPY